MTIAEERQTAQVHSTTARLLIVDGHAYAYRAFYAIRQLTGPDGAPTNAIYGFIKMLAKMRALLQPTHLAVVWDGGLAAERVASLPQYKAQRPPMPDGLARQIDDLMQYLKAAGVATVCQEGVEADDWIASLARHAAANGANVIIASSDKDFMQLVSAQVGLLNPNDKSETVWTADQVSAKAGVAPEQIVDWLSLIGDSVDNIPGVAGVGPKTATELVRQHGSIEAIYQNLDQINSEKLRANLQAAQALVQRNQQLIRLNDRLPGTFDFEHFEIHPLDVQGLQELYAKWGFKTLLQELTAQTSRQRDLF